ncbi:hybrid sensor histidine kinase/response regulator transcription factor [Maribellus mangrovi]|uniref:hybrid sensor histidine kinase/response regulator transcription factor n=1 Tax=Maribellus mangrovi TaxID=3133146 RepID=UPI0030EE9B74
MKNLDGFLAYGNIRNNAKLDHDREFWIAGNTGLLWMRNGNIYRHINKTNGLINDTIIAIEPAEKGIWVVQKGGISFIIKDENDVEVFNVPDALIPTDIQISKSLSENIYPILIKTLNNDCLVAHQINIDGTMVLHKFSFKDSVFFVEEFVKLPFALKRLNEINNHRDLIGYSSDGAKLIYIQSDGTFEPIGEEYSDYFGEDKNGNAYFCANEQDSSEIIRGHISDFIKNSSTTKSTAYFKYSAKLKRIPLSNIYTNDVFYCGRYLAIKPFDEEQEYLLSDDEIIKTKTTYWGMFCQINSNSLWSSKWQTNDTKLITYNPNIILHEFSNDINGFFVFNKSESNLVVAYPRFLDKKRNPDPECFHHNSSHKFKFLYTNPNNRILRDKKNNIWIKDWSDSELKKIDVLTKNTATEQTLKVKSKGWWVPDQEGGVYLRDNDSTFSHLSENFKYSYNFPFREEVLAARLLSRDKLIFQFNNSLFTWHKGEWCNINLSDTSGFRIIDDNNYGAVIEFNSNRWARITENNELKFYDKYFENNKYEEFTFSQTDKHNRTFFLHKNPEDYITDVLLIEENGNTKILPFAKPVNVLFKRYLSTPEILDESKEIVYLLNNDIYIFNDSIGFFYKVGSTNGFLTYIWSSFIDDELYISGWGNHILEVDFNSIKYKLPEIILQNVILADRTKLFLSDEQIELKENQSIAFQYFTTDEYITKNIEYQTKLVGFDGQWKTQAKRNFIEYTHLPPGDYTFMARVIGENWVWSEPVRYNFTVLPLWYQSKLAYTTYLILLSGFIYLIVKISISRLKRKNIILEAKVKEKTDQIINQHLQVEELKNRFYTNISHEFRTPLTLINGNTEQLERETEKPRQKRMIHSIRKASNQLLKLVNEMLDLTKLEADMFKLSGQRTNVVHTIKLVWQMYISEADRYGIKYTCTFSRKNILLWHDKNILEKILQNLISNALKYTQNGGSVHIQTDVIDRDGNDEECLRISVKDNGIGIPSDQIQKIFDRFYQTGQKSIRVTASSGVGLALVKELVELHKGTIEVISEEGTGTEFILLFPMNMEEKLNGDEISENEKTPYQLHQETRQVDTFLNTGENGKTELKKTDKPLILVVEDNHDLREHIKDILHDTYRVNEAINGVHGLELAIKKLPELILSDVMMPEMDGEEMCRKIKENKITSHIPVVLLTAKADKKSKISGLELGADDYITKPFDREELIARIKNLVEQRRLLKQKFSYAFIKGEKKLAGNIRDDKLIEQVVDFIQKNIDRTDITVERLCRELAMSQPNLYRKIKAITNYTPSELIRLIRIKYSISLLQSGNTVSEAAYASGFNSVAYYSKSFKKLMGKSPGRYLKSTDSIN